MRLRDAFDLRSGLLGGGFLAVIVWWLNSSHGPWGASTAAVKQFVYTFFMGALIMRLCTRLALREASDLAAIISAVIVPSMITIGTTFIVHSLRGTPEPVISTIPAALLSPPAFTVWARRVRRLGHSPWD